MPKILRHTRGTTVTIESGAALSDAIHLERHEKLIVALPSAWTTADIGFQVASDEDEPYRELYAADGTLAEISSPAAGNAYAAPSEVDGAVYVKLWSQSGGSDENQGADRDIDVTMKS